MNSIRVTHSTGMQEVHLVILLMLPLLKTNQRRINIILRIHQSVCRFCTIIMNSIRVTRSTGMQEVHLVILLMLPLF